MGRFSDRPNEMIDRDAELVETETPKIGVTPNPGFDPEKRAHPDSDLAAFDAENPGRSIVGVAEIVDEKGQIFRIEHSGVVWREIDDASRLDPPKSIRTDRPKRRTRNLQLSAY